METHITEIAPDTFRLSTFIPEVGPSGLAFNQFLIRGEEPFLFHTGQRQLYPLVSEALGRLIDIRRLRWISFGHVEADELGAMNLLLAAAPHAVVVHGKLANDLSLTDLADRPPQAAADALDIGGHHLVFVPTPHVPHNWESGLWFDETTRALLSGDLFTAGGDRPPVTGDDLVEATLEAEAVFGYSSLGPTTVPTLRRLADLEPVVLATMHNSTYDGRGGDQLRSLADAYGALVAAAAPIAA
jgi:flavorubredoxin